MTCPACKGFGCSECGENGEVCADCHGPLDYNDECPGWYEDTEEDEDETE